MQRLYLVQELVVVVQKDGCVVHRAKANRWHAHTAQVAAVTSKRKRKWHVSDQENAREEQERDAGRETEIEEGRDRERCIEKQVNLIAERTRKRRTEDK